MPEQLSMSPDARNAFLAGVHVAVLAVDEPGRGPLALPIWYEWVDGGVELGMGTDSLKARCLRAAGRATITVQDEAPPYRYVSVEGPVTELTKQRNVRSVAVRYLGEEAGSAYAAQNPATATTVVFRLTPEHWRTQDFSAAG